MGSPDVLGLIPDPRPNVVSDLRAIDLETLRNVHELNLSGLELNAIEQAVAERAQGGA